MVNDSEKDRPVHFPEDACTDANNRMDYPKSFLATYPQSQLTQSGVLLGRVLFKEVTHRVEELKERISVFF
jgi:hypothetical protein